MNIIYIIINVADLSDHLPGNIHAVKDFYNIMAVEALHNYMYGDRTKGY